MNAPLTVDRVAEDDGLVHLELGEERVEAVDLLALGHEGVELRNTLQGKTGALSSSTTPTRFRESLHISNRSRSRSSTIDPISCGMICYAGSV